MNMSVVIDSELELKKRRRLGVYFTIIFIVLIWLVKLIEWTFDIPLSQYGLRPRHWEGLLGVFTSGMLHADAAHLVSNSIALIIVGPMMYYFYRPVALKVFGYAYFLTSILTWIIARDGNHIGASGVIYAIFGFLLVSGFIRRHYPLMAVGLVMLVIHQTFTGSLLFKFIPEYNLPNVSWEGHLAGFLIGVVLAIAFRKEGPQRKVWEWDEDEEDEDDLNSDQEIQIQYHYKE